MGRASQGRRDALNGRWVIFAPGRSERPAEILEAELPAPSGHTCPFCAGNESHTPPETFSIRHADEAELAWTVRVVPNLFPAVSAGGLTTEDLLRDGLDRGRWDGADSILHQMLHPQSHVHFGGASVHHLLQEPGRDGDDSRASIESYDLENSDRATTETLRRIDDAWDSPGGDSLGGDSLGGDSLGGEHLSNDSAECQNESHADLFEYCELHGGHEVIVETPNHVESITSLTENHAAAVFNAYAERVRHWVEVPGVQYVVVFKNVGAAAGASLRHTHSQLIATSLLPPAMEEIGGRMLAHRRRTDRCLLCDMLAGERYDKSRIVTETRRFVAFCPFASRLPYLVRILPKSHQACFEQCDDEALAELSRLTQQIVRSLEAMFVACAYNYTIHTRPPQVADGQSFHWWMEIFPRLTKIAGFEWGSDCYINPVTPEVAAEHLRGEPR